MGIANVAKPVRNWFESEIDKELNIMSARVIDFSFGLSIAYYLSEIYLHM